MNIKDKIEELENIADREIDLLTQKISAITNTLNIQKRLLIGEDNIKKLYEIALSENEGSVATGGEHIISNGIEIQLDIGYNRVWYFVKFDKL